MPEGCPSITINDNIGGPGDDQNLFPITARANSQHVNEVENKVKKWINVKRYWVHYKVDVKVKSKVSDVVEGRPPEKNFVDADFICEAHPLLADGKTHAGGGFKTTIRSVHNKNVKPVPKKVAAGSGEAASDDSKLTPELSTSKRNRSGTSGSATVINTASETALEGLGLSPGEVTVITSGVPFSRHSQIEALVGKDKWQGIRKKHNIQLYKNIP